MKNKEVKEFELIQKITHGTFVGRRDFPAFDIQNEKSQPRRIGGSRYF